MSETNLKSIADRLRLDGKVALITGGAGLLGVQHAEAIAEIGGVPVLIDINEERVKECAKNIASQYQTKAFGFVADITKKEELENLKVEIEKTVGMVDILINNAAVNPKVEDPSSAWKQSRFETMPLSCWQRDIEVGLTGAFFCSQVFGTSMAERGYGVILNIASDLAVIAPDQRLYREPGVPEDQQTVKPVTYSVVKTGLLGLTRYLSTYWAHKGVRVNSISPAGVFNGQNEDFVGRLSNLIPMGRMANKDEYRAAVAFLVSEASSYMTGANVVIDGGRTVW